MNDRLVVVVAGVHMRPRIGVIQPLATRALVPDHDAGELQPEPLQDAEDVDAVVDAPLTRSDIQPLVRKVALPRLLALSLDLTEMLRRPGLILPDDGLVRLQLRLPDL